MSQKSQLFFENSDLLIVCVRKKKRFQYFDEFSPSLIYLHVEETAMLSHGEVVISYQYFVHQ